MWNKLSNIPKLNPPLIHTMVREFVFCLKQGYLMSRKGFGYSFYDLNDFHEININIPKNQHLTITKDNIYYNYSNPIMRLNKDDLKFESLCSSMLEGIGVYNDDYAAASTIVRDPNNRKRIVSQKKEIIKLANCTVIYSWTDDKQFLLVSDYNFLFTFNHKSIIKIDIDSDAEKWQFVFNDDFWGGRRYTQLVDNILVISLSFNDEFDRPDHNHLLGLDINTGEVKWRLENKNIFRWYQFDFKNKKLFTVDGFNNVVYHVIDPLTGTIEIEKNLSESHKNIEVNCHNVFFAEDNYLYFSSNTRAPIGDSEFDYDYLQPQVGAINIQTQELEYLVDIPIDMKNISRPSNALNSAPIVHRNRMYIMDNENYLHILEKQSNQRP